MPVLNIQETLPGTLVFEFPGPATALALEHMLEAIRVRLKKPTQGLKKIVFDLSATDTVINNAGRLFDIARGYQPQLRSNRIGIEMKMPRDVYEDLQRTDDFPQPSGATATCKGIKIVLSDAATSRYDEKKEHTSVLLTCMGKVRELTKDNVVVSLFADEGEIVGDLARAQFPDDKLIVGQVFRYQAVITERGKTEVVITRVQEKEVKTDEILDLWREIEAKVPSDET